MYAYVCMSVCICALFNIEYSTYLAIAKQNNMVVSFQHIKVLLSGSSAAGKSSFCRLLFGKPFSSEYKSTDIMETKQAVTVKSFSAFKKQDKLVWLELNHSNQLKQLKSLLKDKKFYLHSFQNQPSIQQAQAPDEILLHNATSGPENEKSGDVYKPHGDEDKPHVSVTEVRKDVNKPNKVVNKPYTTVESNIMCSHGLPDNLKIDQTVRLITVFDTGGQPEYVMLLPVIDSMPTINFVVHDLTKAIEDPVLVRYKKEGCEETPGYFLNYSNLDMIQLLMCLITDSVEHPLEPAPQRISVPEKSYFSFIGTHYDKVKHSHALLHKVNKKLSDVIEERKSNSKLMFLTPENRVFYPVDNTTAGDAATEDPEVQNIRNDIKEVMDEMETKELPITWMILELEMQELRTSNNKHYINYEEYKNIAHKNAAIADVKEVKASLAYFHVLGIVLHFSDPKLPELYDWIIIDLQWLFMNLAKMMHLSLKDVRVSVHNLKERFNKQRLLAKKILRKIKLEEINQKEIQYFINVLIHLKVISTVTIEQDVYYYLPCALPSTIQYNDEYIFLLSEPLLIQFSSGYLPRGFFCSLVALLLNNRQWKHQLGNTVTKHYSNVITFQLPDETFLRLHDKTYYLEVQVRHYKNDANVQYHSKVFPILKKYLEMVCKQLHFSSDKLQYGFLCHESYNVGAHIVVLDCTEHFLPTELKCSKTPSHKTLLGDSHKIWFNEVCKKLDVLFIHIMESLCTLTSPMQISYTSMHSVCLYVHKLPTVMHVCLPRSLKSQ